MKASGSLIWVVILIIGVLSVGTAVNQGWLGSSLGFTTLSLDQVDFESSNQYFNKPLWVLTVVQGGLGQNAYLHIDNSEISDSGKTSTKDLDLDLRFEEQSCNYKIVPNSDATPIYEYELVEFACSIYPFTEAEKQTHCGNDYILSGRFTDTLACFCIKEQQRTGAIAYNTIQNPSVITESLFTLNNGDEQIMGEFSTDGDISNWMDSDHTVFVDWAGYLSGDEPCPSQDNVFAFYKFSGIGDQYWYTGSETRYTQYLSSRTTLVSGFGTNTPWRNDVVTKVNDVNANANNALVSIAFGDTPAIQDRTTMNNAVIKNLVEEDELVEFPVWVLMIDADYLSISQPSSDIQITNVECSDFQTEGTIVATVANIGSENINVNTWADCQSPLSCQDSGTNSVYVGQTSNFFLDVTADVGTSTTRTCTVHAQTADAAVHRTATVSCTADPHTFCTPGDVTCENDVILECNSDGTAFSDIVDDCASKNQICLNNYGWYCADKDTPPIPPNPDCEWWDIACHLSNLWNWLIAGLTGLFATLGILAVLAIMGFLGYTVVMGRRN